MLDKENIVLENNNKQQSSEACVLNDNKQVKNKEKNK